MYRKESHGLLKHFDFVLLDILCLQFAFILAYKLYNGFSSNPYTLRIYMDMAIFMELINILIMYFIATYKNVLKRGYYKEFISTIKHSVHVIAWCLICLFLMKGSEQYSRVIIMSTFFMYTFFSFLLRVFWKKFLHKKMDREGQRSLLLITNKNLVSKALKEIRDNNFGRCTVTGIVLLDMDLTGITMEGIPVVCSVDSAADYVCKQWVDEVFVLPPLKSVYPEKMMNDLLLTGVTIHLNLAKVKSSEGKDQMVEKMGAYTVLTTSMKTATGSQLFLKRCMDIGAGIVGCFITVLLTLIIGPMIYFSSPGPIFFSQERVGKNGKPFKMYKFRSMYMDAEERKKELMKHNKVSDGRMFKMDFDPRIIGNKILENGEHKTGIGQFIRDFSLDEFPQFWNVLKGDMSVCGYRPALPDEVSLYDLHHRARLSMKPGITGMWQVSGRSDITDFEEVVKLDRDYINNWNIGLDIKILMKTVMVVLKKDGAV